MSISVGDLNTFVSHSVGNCYCRETHVDQQTDVAVSQIVNSDTLDPCGFCPSVHLPVQIALVDREDTVFLPQPVLHTKKLLHFHTEEIRHLNGSVTFLCIGGGDHILPFQTLVGFVDPHRTFLKIEIGGC